MKTKLITMGLAVAVALSATHARADLEVSASVSIHSQADFYAPLSKQGAWVEVGPYGRCWRPRDVVVGWRPYCDGHWIWTDCGWYWASDEPWAWACYHYGTWAYETDYGWIWVPGIEWAPAWVSWRVGGGYVGWAPLAPVRVSVVVPAPQFVFVETARFTDPIRPTTVVVHNQAVFKQTRVVQNVKRETRDLGGPRPQAVMVNEGPGVAVVQKSGSRFLQPVPIREVVHLSPAPAELRRKPDGGQIGKRIGPGGPPSKSGERGPGSIGPQPKAGAPGSKSTKPHPGKEESGDQGNGHRGDGHGKDKFEDQEIHP